MIPHIDSYVDIVRQKSTLRQLIFAAKKMTSRVPAEWCGSKRDPVRSTSATSKSYAGCCSDPIPTVRDARFGRYRNRLLKGAIETDEKMAMDLAGPGYHINRSNLLVLESKAEMQKRGQASPDDGDALALTFAQDVAPAEVEERDEDEELVR